MATKKEETKIIVDLPSFKLETVRIKIKGVTPLVTQPMTLKAIRSIQAKQAPKDPSKPAKPKHEPRNPWEDFIQSIYWLSDPPKEIGPNASESGYIEAAKNGRFGFCVGGIKNSAIIAAYRRDLVKNLVTARGLFNILGSVPDKIYGKQCIEILTPNPPSMRVDCLSTFNSGADMRYRPQFDEWRMEFDVQYDPAAISLPQLLIWFRLGGFANGLGENRTEKGEGWGSYVLDM